MRAGEFGSIARQQRDKTVQQQQQRPPPQVIIIHTVDYDNPSLMQNSSSMEDEEDGGEKQQQQRQAFSMPLPETESLTATVSGGAGGGEDAAQQHPEKKIHHLTRHWLAPESRGTSAIDALGAGSAKAAENMIRYVRCCIFGCFCALR